MKVKAVRLFYYLIVIATAVSMVSDELSFNQFTYPLFIPIIFYLLIETSDGKIYKSHLIYGLGLIFIWIGDLLYLNEQEVLRLLNLLSYSIGYLIFGVIFLPKFKAVSLQKSIESNKNVFVMSVSCLIISTIYLLNHDQDFIGFIILLILITAILITLFIINSINQHLTNSYMMNLAIFSILTENAILIISMDKNQTFNWAVIIVVFHGISQFLLMTGIVKNINN